MSVFSEEFRARAAREPFAPLGDGMCAGCVVAGQVAALEYIEAAMNARMARGGDGADQAVDPVFAPALSPPPQRHARLRGGL